MSTITYQHEPRQEPNTAPLVTITPAALKQIRFLIQKRGDPGLALRIGVKGGGCSGLSYVLNLVSDASDSDHAYVAEDIRILVDPKSARFLEGVTLDYSIKNLLEGGWVFTNPNAGRTCGCGTSFTPK